MSTNNLKTAKNQKNIEHDLAANKFLNSSFNVKVF
jgi:hypothetical protein